MTKAKASSPRLTLRMVNHILSGIVALLAVYIIVMPFVPQMGWWFQHDSPLQRVVPGGSPVAVPTTPTTVEPGQPQDNFLFIPRLDMRETVHGGDIRALRQGVWRLPHTSTPDKGGNTVLVGHRFTYSGQAVFYHLDKVGKGDEITLQWQGKLYKYEVFDTLVVPATEVSVEVNTKEPRLTLYTCTPLLTAKDRLVVQAKLVGATP